MSQPPANRIRIIRADITTLAVDAIVNAANESLLGGGGVDGAIHAAAGPELLAACRKLHGCPTGQSRITPRFRLPAKWVIHTVGPIWQSSRPQPCEALLRGCYESSLQLAEEHAAESIAFPCISTGAYRYPPKSACRVAVATVQEWLADHARPREVIFCCWRDEDVQLYEHELSKTGSHEEA